MVRVWKTKSLLFCLRYDPLIVFRKAKSYNFHFHKNDVTWPLSANGLLILPQSLKQTWILQLSNFAFPWQFLSCLSSFFSWKVTCLGSCPLVRETWKVTYTDGNSSCSRLQTEHSCLFWILAKWIISQDRQLLTIYSRFIAFTFDLFDLLCVICKQ